LTVFVLNPRVRTESVNREISERNLSMYWRQVSYFNKLSKSDLCCFLFLNASLSALRKLSQPPESS